MLLPSKKLLIVEESLLCYTGHCYEYNRAIVSIHRERGIDTTIAARCEVLPGIQQELGAIPLFSRTCWNDLSDSPAGLRRYLGYLGIASHNCYVARTMEHFFDRNSSFDLVFVPFVLIHHWFAWRWLTQRYIGKKFQKLVLFVRFGIATYPDGGSRPSFRKTTIFLQKIIQSFKPFLQTGEVIIGTDSSRHAQEYYYLSGVELTVFPQPRVGLSFRAETHAQKSHIVLSCLGQSRLEKGIDLLLAAIAQVLTNLPNLPVEFVVQFNYPVILPDGTLLEVPEFLRSHPKLTLLTQDLSSEEYAQYFLNSDAVVLPYRRESYYTRLSGLVVEATTCGIPVIYTTDTWMEDAVMEYGAGLGVRDQDVSDLAERMVQMVREIAHFRAMAIAQMPKARAYHSAENFLRCLWGTLP